MTVEALEAMRSSLVAILSLGVQGNNRSSIEAEYKNVVDAELIWIQVPLHELEISQARVPCLWCNNIGATYFSGEYLVINLMCDSYLPRFSSPIS